MRDEKERSYIENGEAIIAKGDQRDRNILVVCSNASERQSNTKWILDSGCTYHMCPNREWFKNFRKINGGKDFLGNNTSCQVIGIGDVQLKMFNGVTRLLQNVRYLLELRKNLISLGQLDTMGGCKDDLLDGDKMDKLEFSESYILGKHHKLSFNIGVHEAKDILN
ncbi:hypothetical protein UlMin_012846 [Ulmus minor]